MGRRGRKCADPAFIELRFFGHVHQSQSEWVFFIPATVGGIESLPSFPLSDLLKFPKPLKEHLPFSITFLPTSLPGNDVLVHLELRLYAWWYNSLVFFLDSMA